MIRKWAAAMLAGETVNINGVRLISRDFCLVAKAALANLPKGTMAHGAAVGQVCNVAVAGRTDLGQLHLLLQAQQPGLANSLPVQRNFGAGGVRHSRAVVGRHRRRLCCAPSHDIGAGLLQVAAW